MKSEPVMVDAAVAAEHSSRRAPRLLSAGPAAPPQLSFPEPTRHDSNVFTFDGGDSRIVFASLLPRKGLRLGHQIADVCRQLDAVLLQSGLTRQNLVRQCVFLRSRDSKEAAQLRLRAFHGITPPATSFIIQPPANGEQVALEILAIQGAAVRVDRVSEHLTIVSDNGCRWAYIGGIEPPPREQDTYRQALGCFEQLHAELQSAGFHFNQVVRTWIYERDIVGAETSARGESRQRYQIMNDARREFFSHGCGGAGFAFSHDLPPASTGIGMSGGSFVMECLALDVPSRAIEIKPLNNPEQIDAHAYSQEVLERGAAAIKAAPLFSRGMSIDKDYRMLLISGTASIKGQATVYLDDPVGQARTTLENIDLVLRQADASLQDLQQIRIYVKSSPSPAEFTARVQAIRSVVDHALPGIPKLYLLADVCRDNLLVEIEALSFVKTPAANA